MSATSNSIAKKLATQSVPAWITSGILGLVLGGGAMFLGMHYYSNSLEPQVVVVPRPEEMAQMMGGMGGMAGGGMGGMMGGGMGGMMGGGPGGGGAGQPKRDLTSLVGKLNLLSEGVRVEFTSEQSNELAVKLASFETAEKMTADEAQENLESLQGILTDEQKAALASIELPRPPRSAGGGGPMGMRGPMGGGRMMGAGAMGGGGSPVAMGGGPAAAQPDDDNPFRQETHQQRLTDLLTRLKGAPSETPLADDRE